MPDREFPGFFYETSNGRYKNIPSDFLDVQPRVPIPIVLKDCKKDNKYRDKLIDLCDLADKSIVENGVLRVTKETIDKLINVLNSNEDGLKMRSYLSSCI